jgi:hypothetical protein
MAATPAAAAALLLLLLLLLLLSISTASVALKNGWLDESRSTEWRARPGRD